MKINEAMVCPKCGGTQFKVRREATYLYTYNLDTSPAEADAENVEALPFLFDNREQIDSKEYLECGHCGAKYACDIDRDNRNLQFTVLQKAVRADHQVNPEFLG